MSAPSFDGVAARVLTADLDGNSETSQPEVSEQRQDWRPAIGRLAALPPIEYDRCREKEAERLGCRVAVLDAEVRRVRSESATPGAGQTLTFPEVEPWPNDVDGAAVLDEIASLCARYLGLPKHGDTVIALWAVMTYLADVLDCLPLLFITAPEKGCGKSTVLDLLQRLCSKPLPASNITTAALFRTVELVTPTLLLDEADSFVRDNDELRGIINSGHTRSAAFAIRVVGDDHQPRRFSTWCPKAMAGIGRLPATIEDRAVIVTMQRLLPGAKREKLRSKVQFPALCSKIARWAADHANEIANATPELPDGLHNRAADNWHPLFATAEIAGGDWPARVRDAASEFAGASNADSVGTELLRAIREVFAATRQSRLPTTRLIELLCEDESARWCEHNHGQPVTGPQIAKLLKRYKIGPKSLRAPGTEKPFKGYDVADFADAFSRYLLPSCESPRL